MTRTQAYVITWRPDLGRWFIVQRDGPSRLVANLGEPRSVALEADAASRVAYARNNHFRVVGACDLVSYGIEMPGTPQRLHCPECGTRVLRTELFMPRHMVQLVHPDPTFVPKRVVSIECIAGVRRS